MPKVLVACEYSGRVRDAFASLGWNAWSCDLLPSETPGNHHHGAVEDILSLHWDVLIAHPPCTHLAVSGARWFKDKQAEQAEALAFVQLLLDAPSPTSPSKTLSASSPPTSAAPPKSSTPTGSATPKPKPPASGSKTSPH